MKWKSVSALTGNATKNDKTIHSAVKSDSSVFDLCPLILKKNRKKRKEKTSVFWLIGRTFLKNDLLEMTSNVILSDS